MKMDLEKEERNCVRCGRSEGEVPLSRRFVAGDFCGIEEYFLCADCESEDEAQDQAYLGSNISWAR